MVLYLTALYLCLCLAQEQRSSMRADHGNKACALCAYVPQVCIGFFQQAGRMAWTPTWSDKMDVQVPSCRNVFEWFAAWSNTTVDFTSRSVERHAAIMSNVYIIFRRFKDQWGQTAVPNQIQGFTTGA